MRMTLPDRSSFVVDIDAPVTADQIAKFRETQKRFALCFKEIFDDPTRARTVLVLPSLSVDQEVVAKITGAHHYEERMLCLLPLPLAASERQAGDDAASPCARRGRW
jgi:hypothetical protein